MPAEKWRAGPGVRSVSEVLMHLRSVGVNAGEDLPKDAEKAVRAKADVVRWLKAPFDTRLGQSEG